MPNYYMMCITDREISKEDLGLIERDVTNVVRSATGDQSICWVFLQPKMTPIDLAERCLVLWGKLKAISGLAQDLWVNPPIPGPLDPKWVEGFRFCVEQILYATDGGIGLTEFPKDTAFVEDGEGNP